MEKRVRYAGFDGRLYPMTKHCFREKIFYGALIDIGMLEGHWNNGRIVFHTSQHLTPHSTRHTFASLSVAAGVQPERLQRIIGHSSFRTTAEIYVHVDNEALISEMDKLVK